MKNGAPATVSSFHVGFGCQHGSEQFRLEQIAGVAQNQEAGAGLVSPRCGIDVQTRVHKGKQQGAPRLDIIDISDLEYRKRKQPRSPFAPLASTSCTLLLASRSS